MPDVSYVVRRSADSGGKLSTSTIIIIAVVSGSVVILVFALFAWRLLVRYCRSSRTVPLPPAQDLAHRREHQLATLADRSTLPRPVTWADHKLVQPHSRLYSSHLLSTSASSASLIRSSPDFTSSHGPTRESSWAVEDTISAESSPHPTPSSDLAPPNPSFLPSDSALAHNSMASVASSFSDAVSDVNAPMTPSDFDPSVESTPSLVHSSLARPRPPRPSRSRPISTVSASGTVLSIQNSQSTNTLRGPPHSIHSNIQIVLPAPLAPDLYPYQNGGASFERASSFYGSGGDSSRSIADPWVMAGSRPQSMARLNREASSGSRMSSCEFIHHILFPHQLALRARSLTLRDTQWAQGAPRPDKGAVCTKSRPHPPSRRATALARGPAVPSHSRPSHPRPASLCTSPRPRVLARRHPVHHRRARPPLCLSGRHCRLSRAYRPCMGGLVPKLLSTIATVTSHIPVRPGSHCNPRTGGEEILHPYYSYP
ncbi:hypothetical protein C8Q74DRAFT_179282 [Fomes fomentarius]|nr:hypothetical protein C8Q74DRAFT_179282 [Fomes fomentarius]